MCRFIGGWLWWLLSPWTAPENVERRWSKEWMKQFLPTNNSGVYCALHINLVRFVIAAAKNTLRYRVFLCFCCFLLLSEIAIAPFSSCSTHINRRKALVECALWLRHMTCIRPNLQKIQCNLENCKRHWIFWNLLDVVFISVIAKSLRDCSLLWNVVNLNLTNKCNVKSSLPDQCLINNNTIGKV